MAYRETRDEALLRTFYEAEQQMPRHWKDASNVWTTDWDSFKAFCSNCEHIYSIGETGLVYVQRIGCTANLHFSLLRGSSVQIPTLIDLREQLFLEYDMLFAYVGTRNAGLKQIVRECGMTFSGLEMRRGHTRNRIFVWQLFTVTKNCL